jgi:hypothetical protein
VDQEHRHRRVPREITQIVDLFYAREHTSTISPGPEFMLGDHEDDYKAFIGQRLEQVGMDWTVKAPTPSSPSDASRSAHPKTGSGPHRTTTCQPPDQSDQLNGPDHLQKLTHTRARAQVTENPPSTYSVCPVT